MKYLNFVFYRPIFCSRFLWVSRHCPSPGIGHKHFLILPALMTIMTITPLEEYRAVFPPHTAADRTSRSGKSLANYIILGNLIIFASLFFIREEGSVRHGAGCRRPARGLPLLSLSKSFRADLTVSSAGFAGAYLAFCRIIPLIVWVSSNTIT